MNIKDNSLFNLVESNSWTESWGKKLSRLLCFAGRSLSAAERYEFLVSLLMSPERSPLSSGSQWLNK